MVVAAAKQAGRRIPSGIAAAAATEGFRPTSKSLVVPATPTKDHWLPLSNLDRVVNSTFCSIILFYEKILSSSYLFHDIVASLKQSLAKVLVEFYPLAGRLAVAEDGKVDLHCNDRGAVFIEAFADVELNAVGGPQPMPHLSGLNVAGLGNGPRYVPDQLSPMPTLVVQVTRFKCGSVALAANWHHTLADGVSGCHFMKSWAEVATGSEISLVPNHARELLSPRDPPDASLVNDFSTRNARELHSERSHAELQQTMESTVLNTFQIGNSAMQELKERASKDADDNDVNGGGRFTSAETVSAHLWRQMTKARAENMNANATSETRFFLYVDGRKRLGLPKGYFGNVVCSVCAVCSETAILSKPLAFAAGLIRKATRGASADYFRSLIDWAELQGSAPAKPAHGGQGHDVAATFWTYFPLYEMDFGWGKPVLAARNSPVRPLVDGIAMMPTAEGPGKGGMVALLNLRADRMDRLHKQPSFQAVFS